MNLLERIMLELGYVSVERYNERNDEGNHLYETLEEASNLLSEVYEDEIDSNDNRIKEFLDLHTTYDA